MNDWVAALRGVEARISKRKGQFALFAVFLPSEAADQWDLVVSAPWARRDDRVALDIIRDELAASIDERDTLRIARIVVVEPWHPDVQKINAQVDVEHGLVSITSEEHFGYIAERGFIITSKDYWHFIKHPFPRHADFVFYTRDGDLRIRISWPLSDDPSRPAKRSKNIILAITEEALSLLSVDDPDDRVNAEKKLAAFVADRWKGFDPSHDAPAHTTPPREKWSVTTDLFRRSAAAVG